MPDSPAWPAGHWSDTLAPSTWPSPISWPRQRPQKGTPHEPARPRPGLRRRDAVLRGRLAVGHARRPPAAGPGEGLAAVARLSGPALEALAARPRGRHAGPDRGRAAGRVAPALPPRAAAADGRQARCGAPGGAGAGVEPAPAATGPGLSRRGRAARGPRRPRCGRPLTSTRRPALDRPRGRRRVGGVR